MNRLATFLLGPETVLALFGVLLFWFCAHHNSGTGRDVEIMERLIFLLPFVVTPLAFATIFVPGARSWWWLARVVVSAYVALFVCGTRLINGLGSGAKGQDAAFILLIVLGTVAVALPTAVSGATILAGTKPGFGSWFQAHKILGSVLTLLSAVPIGFLLGTVVAVCSAFLLAFFVEVFKR